VRPEELERALGARLRELRIDRRLTQVELADRANISVGALQHLEGGSGATTSTLTRVLHALGRDAWIDQLGSPSAFNPLELLDGKPLRRPQRVRHRAGRREKAPVRRARVSKKRGGRAVP
jgi:transcriptional regulator with XRE-family HTH domain